MPSLEVSRPPLLTEKSDGLHVTPTVTSPNACEVEIFASPNDAEPSVFRSERVEILKLAILICGAGGGAC